jgi:hypothetical protein
MNAEPMEPVRAWRRIPGMVEAALAGADHTRLDAREGDAMTLREVVHHIAEANVVAASIVVAACGAPGCTYDWSWMMPFGPWMERMAYTHKPLASAVRLLGALNEYVAEQVENAPGALAREVLLVDAVGAEPRRVTVADVLHQEVEHAREHLAGG